MSENGNGTARWQLWVSAAGIAIVVFGAIMALYMMATSAYQKAESLERRMMVIEVLAAQNRTDVSVIRSDMAEIDTQLRASIDDRNLGHAWDLRIDAMLWEQAFKGKSHLPIDNAVYPNIADGKSR